jgi:hypothetical protein
MLLLSSLANFIPQKRNPLYLFQYFLWWWLNLFSSFCQLLFFWDWKQLVLKIWGRHRRLGSKGSNLSKYSRIWDKIWILRAQLDNMHGLFYFFQKSSWLSRAGFWLVQLDPLKQKLCPKLYQWLYLLQLRSQELIILKGVIFWLYPKPFKRIRFPPHCISPHQGAPRSHPLFIFRKIL